MKPVMGRRPLDRRYRAKFAPGQDVEEHGPNTPYAETEDEALDVKARSRGKVEETRWRPVGRNKQRLC